MKLSVIIVSFNVEALLRTCLDSLLPQLNEQDEVYVIDNDSSDNSVAVANAFAPRLKVICSSTNLGFSAANNLGIQKATGDYILLLNPDTELLPNSLEAMLRGINKYGKNHVFGAHLLNTDRSLQVSVWNFPTAWHMLAESLFLSRWINNRISGNILTHDLEVPAISGAAILIETDLLKKMNGLDPELFWMEDTDLCYRSGLLGNKIIWLFDWTIIHHSGKSSVSSSGIPLANQIISRLKFYGKHKCYVSLVLGHIAAIIQLISRTIILHIGTVVSAKAAARAKAYRYACKRYFLYLMFNDRRIL
jgi:N-acetylglucosaminyl-diphospho-decaprenol L-rhamnosyltransferase